MFSKNKPTLFLDFLIYNVIITRYIPAMGKASSGRYKNSVRETGRRRINNMTIELTKMQIKEDFFSFLFFFL